MRWFTVPDSRAGFALPTLLIASVVMLIIMVSAVSAVGVTRVALNNQYYNQLAREAAESGANRAAACMEQDAGVATWSVNGENLYPNSNCDGSIVGGASVYTLSTPTVRSSFVVGVVVSETTSIRVSSTSTVELLRTTSGAPIWKTYTSDTVINIPLGVVASTASSSGIFQVCGIIDAQTWCWGRNRDGQLGDGKGGDGSSTYDSNIPVRAARLPGALQGKTDKFVSSGNLYNCIVTTENKVYCMGDNTNGTLGDGTSTDRNVPTPVDVTTGLAGKTITGITTSHAHTCAIADGDVYCWGAGGYGRIGNGSTANQLKPTRVAVIGSWMGKTVTAIASTPQIRSTCAVADGKAYCWGDNDRGQLGDGTTTQRTSPVAVTASGVLSGKTVTAIALGGGFPVSIDDNTTPDRTRRGTACAVTSDGGLYCWGSNQYGQMGQGTTSLTRQTTPIKVNGALSGKNVVQVATAYATVCALTDTGLMYCWGQNDAGAVGDGTMTNRSSPTAVTLADPGLLGKTITYISGGVNRSCAIAEGTTYCWGLNTNGQIGDGTYITRTVPTEATFLKRRLPAVYF